MIEIPGIKITQGEVFDGQFTVVGRDWTGYTGEGLIKAKRTDEDSLLTFVPTGTALGVIDYQITDTDKLPALPRAGTFATCWMQIKMTNGTDVVTFQAPVGVYGAL